MEPSQISEGNGARERRHVVVNVASMEPSLISEGNGFLNAWGVVKTPRFNGALADQRGKPRRAYTCPDCR